MFSRIKKLVHKYDKRLWEWLEGSGDPRPKSDRSSMDRPKTRSHKSGGSFYAPSNEMEIPDPWD